MYKNKKRILVIGLDGATFDLISPWLHEGRLLNIEKLIKKGVCGILWSVIPPLSSPAWVSFMTGKNPGKHGIFDFFVYPEDSYFEEGNPHLVTSHHISGKTLWEILSEKGKKVGVINVPITYPPKKVNGFLISGFLTPLSAKVFTYPKVLGEEIKGYKIELNQLRKFSTLGKKFPIEEYKKMKSLSVLKEQYEVTEKRVATTLKLMEKWDTDFLMVVFRGTDTLQHLFWNEKDILLKYYKKIDEIIGTLLKQAGEEANVFIMSDHGFGPAPQKVFFINAWLNELGFLKMNEKLKSRIFMNIYKKSARIASKLIGATRLFIILSRSAYKKAMNKFRDYIDWNETTAYAEDKGIKGIKITNFKGKEEYEAIRENIINRLKELKDPETGDKIIKDAYKKEDIYTGPFLEKISDIVILPNPNYMVSYAFSDTIVKPFEPIISASHFSQLNGIFLAHGPGIKRGTKIQSTKIYDIAPTILHIFGIPIPKDMDGRVLKEIFEEGSELAKCPIKYEEVEEKERVKEKVRELKAQRKI
jgi:predicted AlkP superfamily phosphohydrolase/phosphomutase